MKHIEAELGARIASITPLSGGDVSSTVMVTTQDGRRLAVKHGADTLPGMFECEADGLNRIRAGGAVRTPNVICVHDGASVPVAERFLALEFVPSDQRHEPLFGRRFGAALARMHIASPSPNGRYGLEHDNFLGRQTQTNAWGSSWPEFYRDRRITPQLSQARPILGSIAGRVDALICRVNELLAGMPHTPCLIHGDLWSGNFLASAGEPVLVDPAVYYGHPEIEWAFIDLFGGFPSGMRVGYDEVAPLDRNYEHRRPLLQLYHLLVHVNHFGGPYVHAVDRVCAFYGE